MTPDPSASIVRQARKSAKPLAEEDQARAGAAPEVRQLADTVVMDERLRAAILCALASCALVLAFTTGQAGVNPASRMATMDALVHDDTYRIDNSVFAFTPDKVRIGEHFYSSKPPVLSVAGAVIYGALHDWTGLSFRENREDAVQVMNLILVGLPHLALLFYGYFFLRWFAPSPHALIWTYACLALGQLGLAYATSLNNHTPCATVVFIAFYYAFGLRHRHLERARHWVLAGFFAGLAPVLDLGAMFISVLLAVYLLTLDWRSTFLRFAPAALIPLIAHFALTYRISGGIVPIYLRPELYRYPGSYWNAPTGVDALDEPRLTYLWNILFGHHGLFSMTPVLILAVVALGMSLARRDRYVAESLVVGVPLVVMITFYTLTTKNYGGVCIGFRWFLPIVPVLMLFVGDWLSRARFRASFVLFLTFMLIGQFHAYDALTGPWQVSSWDRWLTEPASSADP